MKRPRTTDTGSFVRNAPLLTRFRKNVSKQNIDCKENVSARSYHPRSQYGNRYVTELFCFRQMEKPSLFPDAVWSTLNPEQKQEMINFHMNAVKNAVKNAVTNAVTNAVAETCQQTRMSELFRIGGPDVGAAKKLLRAATDDSYSSISETIQKLKELEKEVNQHAVTAQAASEACHSQVLEVVNSHFTDLSSAIEIVRVKQVAAIQESIEGLSKFHSNIVNAEEVARATLLKKSFQLNKERIRTLLSRLAEGKVAWTFHNQRAECLTRDLSLEV